MDTVLAIIGLIISVLSLFPIYFAWQKSRKMRWLEVESRVRLLWRMLEKDKFRPDIVVCCPNGGLILTDIIWSNHSRAFHILCLNVTEATDVAGNHELKVSDALEIGGDFTNKKILVVDDIVKTGSHMRAITQYLILKCGASRENIKTAAIGSIGVGALVKLDYVTKKYERRPKFPWDSWSNMDAPL